ncbi:uncharacterized protein LOC141649462 [Silene latifolia]|uniref:uncharacterized protein LOC141649462 n=1 Tax=Silene latifolia TaxID=37657 RepID=UPI003D778848
MSGGITRLKEHLANQAGNVAPCPKVSSDVRKEMRNLLDNFKAAKKDKAKRAQEFEEEMVGSYRHTQYDDDEEDDDIDQRLAHERYQSWMQHEADHRRPYRQFAYGEGGSRLTHNCIGQGPSKKQAYLPEAYKEMKGYIKTLAPIWDERGVTIMCDGWTGPKDMHVINFLVYSVRGTIFHKSVDASNVLREDENYYFKLMKDVVEEIGPQRVIQIVTDNEAAVKLGGKKIMETYPHIYWTACAAYCLDLLLEDLGKRKSIHAVIEQAKEVSRFI